MSTPLHRCLPMLAAALLQLSASAHPATGQESSLAVEEGMAVRVTAPGFGLRNAAGTIANLAPGELSVTFDDGTSRSFTENGAEYTLQVRNGTRDLRVPLGIAGAGVGIVAGLLMPTTGDAACPDPDFGDLIFGPLSENNWCRARRESASDKKRNNVLLAGLVGAGTGILIGRNIDVDRWTTIEVNGVPARIIPVVSTDGTAGVRVSLTAGD